MSIDEVYRAFNLVLSPWLIAGLAAIQFVLAFLLGRTWRRVPLFLVGLAAVVVMIVYLLFGFDLLVDLLGVRVAGRIAIFGLLAANDLFLLFAYIQAKGSAKKDDD